MSSFLLSSRYIYQQLKNVSHETMELSMDIKKIYAAETSKDHWKDEALLWWRMYLRNVQLLRNVREQNRLLRLLISDYANKS